MYLGSFFTLLIWWVFVCLLISFVCLFYIFSELTKQLLIVWTFYVKFSHLQVCYHIVWSSALDWRITPPPILLFSLYFQRCRGEHNGYFFFICQELINGIFEYKFIPRAKKWSEAWDYCKKKFHDLAVLSDESKLNAAVIQRDFPVWTGLRRNGKDQQLF